MSNSDTIYRRHSPVPLDKCGAALATDIISDRWTILIMREAFYGVMRYDDFRADIGIPRSVLTDRLKRLVDAEMLKRIPYREGNSRTRYGYAPTETGLTFGLPLLALMAWGDTHLAEHGSAIKIVDRSTGTKLKVAIVPEDTPEIGITDVRIVPKQSEMTR
ncbi:helix-turn-helix domain-containing protein [Cognatiyoonia sp. IB215446]|uniref:winged helix-turn-helix transcriptional regulator n=1 Tax=Cognatiyoonia sp. IB215446 TaxID=3097355 RepID=UPI002A18671D|nr:helix-turn-helix domain-containing protein [Cognatiyoonia sp. IB215446]MDX8346964.1 helix-turn-helix domain-containing protein [Cognatiyoonia sp. IB215446]